MGSNNGRYFDGFLMGLLIGGAAVFLLGTKRGNKILKVLTEEGLDGLGEIVKQIENEAKKETKKELKKVEEKIEDFEESVTTPSGESENGHQEEVKPQVRRFFKKSPPKN